MAEEIDQEFSINEWVYWACERTKLDIIF